MPFSSYPTNRALQYFSINDTDTVTVNIYSGVITGGGQAANTELLEFTKSNLIVDGKYHMYKAEDVFGYLHEFPQEKGYEQLSLF